MHIFKNEFEVYKERLEYDFKKKYKRIIIHTASNDINNYIENILITVRIIELDIQRTIKINPELFNSMGEMDKFIKEHIEEQIKIMLKNYFVI